MHAQLDDTVSSKNDPSQQRKGNRNAQPAPYVTVPAERGEGTHELATHQARQGAFNLGKITPEDAQDRPKESGVKSGVSKTAKKDELGIATFLRGGSHPDNARPSF